MNQNKFEGKSSRGKEYTFSAIRTFFLEPLALPPSLFYIYNFSQLSLVTTLQCAFTLSQENVTERFSDWKIRKKEWLAISGYFLLLDCAKTNKQCAKQDIPHLQFLQPVEHSLL